ncbi:MAG: ABC transporter ATP-binding protein [Mycoplasmataceae bacterium]|nr:ABC transporter ATP-binding protein [Mycoplasmataceae bacterium]
MLKVENLSISMNEKPILKNVSFTIEEGSLCAFIGANGAGKTTTIKSIVGLYPYTQGKITIKGIDAKNPMSHYILGYVPEKENFPKIKVKRFLKCLNEYYHLDSQYIESITQKLYKLFNIENLENIRLTKLSSGQKKKLLIIQALINKPSLLIMDEPTENMDPDARLVFYDIVQTLKKLKKTIFISTHNLDEIQKYADHVIVIDNGEIKFIGDSKDKNLYALYEKYVGKQQPTIKQEAVKKITATDVFKL